MISIAANGGVVWHVWPMTPYQITTNYSGQIGYTTCYSTFLVLTVKNKTMAEFKFEGYTYDLWIKPWKKGNKKYEALRWKTGLKCTWERIPYELFIKMKNKWTSSRSLANVQLTYKGLAKAGFHKT